LNEYQPGRLVEFDDHLLHQIVFFGDADEIIKVFTRYIKKKITRKNGISFKTLVSTFLDTPLETTNVLFHNSDYEGSKKYYKFFWNIVLILSIVKFDKRFIEKCLRKFLVHLNILSQRDKLQLHHFSSFIHSNGAILGEAIINDLFIICLGMPSLHSSDVFNAFVDIKDLEKFSPCSDEQEFKMLSELVLEKCRICGENHGKELLPVCTHLRKPYKKILSNAIQERVRLTEDFGLYYRAAIFGIIDYKVNFEGYLKSLEQLQKNVHPFLSGEISMRKLNDLMNLVFKFNIKLPTKFISKYKGISKYYDWLIGMEKFNYKEFNPLWILQYPTKWYLKRIFSQKIIRVIVVEYLKENNQPTLAEYYAQNVR